ncbi:alpha/beta hydrolase [Viridibacillus soli]|nr:alpha/beta hydrolase [Viridibacillus soli]
MLRIGVTILAAIITLLSLYILFSPKPTAIFVKRMFEGGVAIKPANYDDIEKKTKSWNDLDYASNYGDGFLDIIVPKDNSEKVPVVLWIHGGAFVGGDKKDITEYAVQIASHGYAVVNMNYELAPGGNYPKPLQQIDEVYQFIEQNAEKYKLNLDQLYIAGDSAGAQIASQYINIQVNANYAEKTELKAVVPADTIKGALLFCGPYDIQAFGESSDSKLMNFIFKRVGWAYIGERNWLDHPTTKLASTIDHVSADYVPTFITDGNEGSFEEQGKALTEKLTTLYVPVTSIFYEKDEAVLGHEYQFMMNTKQAEHTFEELIQFLDARTE